MNYYKGEFLHAEDFQCEQDFHSSLRKIHNLTLHTSGIVKGLDVIAGTGEVTVKAGVAIDIIGRELILESDQKVTVSSSTDITIFYNEVDDPETDEGGFKGVKQKTVTCEVIAGTAPDGVAIAKVTNAGANPVTLDLSNRKYSAPVANGDVIVGGNMEVKGNLTVQGDTTIIKTKRVRGNVELGDEDSDTVTVKGILKTGHSSGKLKINSSVDMTGSLSVTSGSEIFFQDNGQIRSLDNSHRILFRRSENKLELREYGDIIFSPGATAGAETAKVVMSSNGFTKALGLSVNDAVNSGVGRGLWLWSPTDSNHVIYSANPSGKSPADKTPATGYFGNTHRLRLRTAIGQGFLFENSNEAALVDIDSDDGRLWAKGGIYAGNSDIYFTKTDHNHSGIGNAAGYAAIENAANYNALMILGRATGGTPNRVVKLWDYLEVNGELIVNGMISSGNTNQVIRFRHIDGKTPNSKDADHLYLQYSTGKGVVIGRAETNSHLNVYGDIQMHSGKTIVSDGRMHIHGEELLYLLNKDGVIIGKEWGGNGNLTVQGVALKHGGGSWGAISDKRLKKNVKNLTGVLERLLQLRGIGFEWKEPEKQGNLTGSQIGFIADDVEKVFPEWVFVSQDGYKGLMIRGFEALTVESFREIKSILEDIKAENRALANRIKQLEKEN